MIARFQGSMKLRWGGFALWWAWWDLFRFSDAHLLPLEGGSGLIQIDRFVMEGAFLVVCLAMLVGRKRFVGFCLSPRWTGGACALAVAGTLLFYLAGYVSVPLVSVTSCMAIGYASGYFFFAYFTCFAYDPQCRIELVAPFCLLADGLIMLLFCVAHFFVPSIALAVLHCLMPLTVLLLLGDAQHAAVANAAGKLPVDDPAHPLIFPKSLMASLFVYGFMFGFILNIVPAEPPSFPLPLISDEGDDHVATVLEVIGCISGALIFLVFALRSRGHDRYLSLRFAVTPFVCFAILSLPVFGDICISLSKMIMWTGYEYLDLIMMVIYTRTARSWPANPLTTNAQGQAADVAGIVAGMGISFALFGNGSAPFGDREWSLIVAVVAIALFVVTMWLMTDRNIETLWGLAKRDPIALNQERHQQRVAIFAERFGLTARETEVLSDLLLMRKPDLVAEKQTVSVRTVRYHIGNIYTKADVHSLVDLVKRFDELTEG